MSFRIDGWLWGSSVLQKRKWGCTSWEPKSWQVSARASYRYSLRTLKLVSSPNAEVAHSQVGGLEKMRHSSSHNRGDVQAHCCPSHSRPDLLDWWPASSWHMESVERWKCGGEREIKSNLISSGGKWISLGSWLISTEAFPFRWLEELLGSWGIIFQGWRFSQPLETMSLSLLTPSLNPRWPGILVGELLVTDCLSLLETWRYVLALHYSGGGVGRVVGRGAQLDNQVGHQTLFVWKKWSIRKWKLSRTYFDC